MSEPTFSFDEIIRNQSYFLKGPKQLQNAFFEYLRVEFQKNYIKKDKARKEKLKVLKEQALDKIAKLKISNTKKYLLMKAFHLALQKAAVEAGIKEFIKRKIASKLRLARLRKLIMLHKMRKLRERRSVEALKEFEDRIKMHKLQLEREYDELIKKLDEEKLKRTTRRVKQKPEEVAHSLSENLVDLCDIMSEILEIDKQNLPLIQEHDKKLIEKSILEIELVLRNNVDDSTLFDEKMMVIVNKLEKVYVNTKAQIPTDNINSHRILVEWSNQIETNVINWLDKGHIVRYDRSDKQKILHSWQNTLHSKPNHQNNKSVQVFTPLKTKAQERKNMYHHSMLKSNSKLTKQG